MMKKTDIPDFYKQLSLLLNSNLPLSESLRQLALNLQKEDFRELVLSLVKDTHEGLPLSSAMKKFPEHFQPFHIKMIEGGEKSGTLPEILAELAYMSHIDTQLVSMVKSIAAYPIAVIGISVGIMFLIYTFIVPNFKRVFEDLLAGVPLPLITQVTINISDFCVNNFVVLSALLSAVVIFSLWLFISNSATASRIFIKIIKAIPLSNPIFMNLMMARICSMWSVLLRQKMSANDAFETIADLVDDEKISSALKNIARNVADGKSLSESLKKEKIISGLIAVVAEHAPENELAKEFAYLANIYKDRATTAIRNTGMTWEIILIMLMSIQVGAVVTSLFMPLIKIIEVIGGGG